MSTQTRIGTSSNTPVAHGAELEGASAPVPTSALKDIIEVLNGGQRRADKQNEKLEEIAHKLDKFAASLADAVELLKVNAQRQIKPGPSVRTEQPQPSVSGEVKAAGQKSNSVKGSQALPK